MVRKILLLILLWGIGFVAISPLTAYQDLSATTNTALNLYAAPTTAAEILAPLAAATSVQIEGRNAIGHWLLVTTAQGIRGWIASGSMTLAEGVSLPDLPVTEEIFAPVPPPPPLSDDPEIQSMIARLQATPILYNLHTEQVTAIFERGQQLGNRANVFSKVGDSNTTSGDFLLAVGLGLCRLGAYSYLQDTIDYFSTISPHEGANNSFDSYSVAAANGMSTAAALDPFWADGRVCEANESPLACEYRIAKPSVALIMLGLMDVRYLDGASYYANMERIVQYSIEQGVIPVLTSNVVLPDQETLSFEMSIEINNALVELAEVYEIPFINLWSAVQTLPHYGIGPDRTHLAHAVGEFCAFDGSEQQLGGTLRNLLSLQALDELRRAFPF